LTSRLPWLSLDELWPCPSSVIESEMTKPSKIMMELRPVPAHPERQVPASTPALPVAVAKSPSATDELEELRFTLRAARFVFSQIDRSLRVRAGYVSRNTWILEAISEKLKREMLEDER
jgi:hypothetical protein